MPVLLTRVAFANVGQTFLSVPPRWEEDSRNACPTLRRWFRTVVEETNQPSLARRAVLLYSLAALVSLVGLADAIYLTVEHISGRSVKCTLVSGCSEVLSSPYATVRGYPLAALGAIAYFVVFSFSTLIAFGYRGLDKLLAIIVGAMFLTTLWLLYLQAFVIGHFCQFCLLSALVTTTLAVLVVIAARIKRPAR